MVKGWYALAAMWQSLLPGAVWVKMTIIDGDVVDPTTVTVVGL